MIRGISRRSVFQRLRREGVRARHGPLAMTFVADPDRARPEVAFAIPRRVGSAVRRNRCRRRVRAILEQRARDGRLAPGCYLVVVREPLDDLDRGDLEAAVDCVLAQLSEGRGR